MVIIELICWASAILILYPFVIYPPLLKLLAAWKKNPQHNASPVTWPRITFLISAYNEANVIGDKLDNALSVEYPRDRLEILVVSDASDDGTDMIVLKKAETDDRISLFRQKERKGKTAGLNTAMSEITSDIVIFSDANAMYRPDAFRELVKPFEDPNIGYVVGAAVYNEDAQSLANRSEGAYWDSELAMKQAESDFYSVVGGDGAIYAIRRHLYWPLDEDDINDFANPLQIIAAGYKGVFNPKAVCSEDAADNFEKEYNRKRRIVNRSFRALSKYIRLFNIRRHWKFLFMLISHKVLRWLTLCFIVTCAASAMILSASGNGGIYSLISFGFLLSVGLALVGRKKSRDSGCPKIFYLAYYCYLVSIAGMLGIIDNFKGKYHVTWEHIRK